MLKATLLGCGGMMPLKERALTSLMVSLNGRNILIDCGEGTQIQARAFGLSIKQIDTILLTHYHGDHICGLPGLLLSMGNNGRTEPVLIAGPVGLTRVISACRSIAQELPFDLRLLTLEQDTPQPFTSCGLNISYCRLRHSLPCLGYRLDLPRAGRFEPQKAAALGIPVEYWGVIQKEGCAEYRGKKYTADMVMTPPRKGISLVYATDTRPTEELAALADHCDLLITESMYGDPEKADRAEMTGHMLMTEAALTAAQAHVKALWLTHFSPSMPDPTEWLPLAKELYPDTVLGYDGISTELMFDRDDC